MEINCENNPSKSKSSTVQLYRCIRQDLALLLQMLRESWNILITSACNWLLVIVQSFQCYGFKYNLLSSQFWKCIVHINFSQANHGLNKLSYNQRPQKKIIKYTWQSPKIITQKTLLCVLAKFNLKLAYF